MRRCSGVVVGAGSDAGAGVGRVVGGGRAVAPAAAVAREGWAAARVGSAGAERDPLRAAHGAAVELLAQRRPVGERADLLAPAPRVAAGGRLGCAPSRAPRSLGRG